MAGAGFSRTRRAAAAAYGAQIATTEPESNRTSRVPTATLSAEEGDQIYVPKGFAHGYCTLEPDTEVAYKVDAYYSPEHDRGVLWNDPDLAVPWPLRAAEVLLSAKDARLPRFADLPAYFE